MQYLMWVSYFRARDLCRGVRSETPPPKDSKIKKWINYIHNGVNSNKYDIQGFRGVIKKLSSVSPTYINFGEIADQLNLIDLKFKQAKKYIDDIGLELTNMNHKPDSIQFQDELLGKEWQQTVRDESDLKVFIDDI